MILLFIYWIFLLPLFLGWGVLLHRIVSVLVSQRNYSADFFSLILLGVAMVGLLANVLSFILPLGKDPYLLLILYGLACAFIVGGRSMILDAISRITLSEITGMVFFAVLIIVVCKSASPSELRDEKGYYLPFIKWVETYGITPGLANLQGRFGFNSSWHILSALVSLRWSGFLFYDLNGFIILIIIGYHFFGVSKSVTPIRYASGLFVSAFIFRDFLTSSAADLPNIYLSSLVILWMVDKYEHKTLGEIDYTFIVSFFISVYLVTIKPSSIYLLLIYLPTIIIVLRSKQFNKLIWLIGIGFLFVVPWCARFYITTGYLVFPIASIDLFNPDWKVPYQNVVEERNAVKCFPISNTLPIHEVLKMSFIEWFPQWFKNTLFEQKVFLAGILVITLYYIIRIKRYIHELNDRLFLCIQCTLLLNIVIWLTQYPDFRFAWGFILAYVFIGAYAIAGSLPVFKNNIQMLTLLFLMFMTSMHVFKTLKDVSGNYKNILLKQAAFPEGEVKIEKIHNTSYYKSLDGWDIPLPSILRWQHPNIVLRDSTLEEGFRTVKQ